jgi:hypothetical protein
MNAQAFSPTAMGDAQWVTSDVRTIPGRPARSFDQFATSLAPGKPDDIRLRNMTFDDVRAPQAPRPWIVCRGMARARKG